jgi:ABC-type amino acid transport substrate-binding protein
MRLSVSYAVAAAILLLAVAPAAQAQDNLIEEIKSRGVLRACFAEALPMNYKDPQTGQWAGYNIDAGQNLAESLGVQFEVVDATWGTVIPSLLTGKCDIALINLFMTLERAQVVLFTDPWGVVTKSAAVREGSEITSYDDLNDPDVTITVLSGTGDENHVRTAYPEADIRAIASDSVSTIFVEVASNRADVAVTDTTTLREVLEGNANMRLHELDEDPVAPQPYAYAVKPGEYHWHNYLNIWMKRTEELGLKRQWWKKWLGEDSVVGQG